jgi:cysteine-rich repeat protein
LILGAASQIKTNGSSFDGDGGAGGSISLIAERGNVTVGGLIDATGATPDGSGGTVEVSSAGLVQIDGTIDTDGKGTGSDGGGIELEGQNGVTVSSSGNVEASGGSANGGDISLTGLVGTIAGDVIATASNGGNGGAISLLHCSVTLSGKLDVGASGGGLAGATAISARAVHLTTTGQLLAGSCAAGTDCHVFTLNDAVNLMDDGATITGGHQVVEDASQSLCCGNGAVDHVDEECDDGNASFCDGCTPSCAQEGSPVCPDDGNFCTDEICDAVEGCIVQPTLCPSDNIGCTDDCHSTLGCVPTPNDAACSDGNPCSMDQCDPGAGDPMTGCLYSNEPDGLACKDGDPCTTADTCQAGLCTPGPPACCDDSNPCTADSCSPTKGCVNTEQGILCPSCAGQPAGTPCTDGNQNTIGDMCNGAGACAPGVPRLCDDGNACTLDFILSGICGHSDVLLCPAVCTNQPDGTPCSDQNVCTVGTCQSGVCVNVPISCGDSDPLNGEDDCAQSPLLPPGCVSTFPLSNCGGPICGNGLVEIGEDCDDGGTAPGDCCSATCSYEAVGSPCPDDGNLCTNEACDGAGVCTHPNNSDPCDDGDACTEDDTCSTGACGGSAVDCDDTDPCTTDTCDTGAGCQHDPIPGCGSDLDADGKVDAADECTTLSHSTPPASPPDQNPSRAALSLKNLDRPAGEQKVTAKGFWNPAVASPPIDPAANGIHFYLEDASGSFYSVSVPGGAVGAPGLCDPSDGWTTAASNTKTIWKYRNKSGAFPPACAAGSANGISKVQIKDLTSSSKAAYQMKVSAKDATFTAIPAAPLSRMQMSIAMAAQPSPGTAGAEAISGQCAEFLVTGAPIPTGGAKPFCKVTTSSGAARTISCKGP